jgi:hypothetical protein
MVQRILVRAHSSFGRSDTTNKSSTTLTTGRAILVSAPVLVALGLRFDRDSSSDFVDNLAEKIISSRWGPFELLSAIAVVLILIGGCAARLCKSMDNKEASLASAAMLYVMGIQLCKVRIAGDSSTNDKKTKGFATTSSKRQSCYDDAEANDSHILWQSNVRFIPKEQIIDSIVTEHILAHKVLNLVMLRVRSSGRRPETLIERSPTASKGDNSLLPFELVNVFPNVELTYNEALGIRHQIQRYLSPC